MRNRASTGAVAAAFICAVGLGGCQRDLEYHFGPLTHVERAPVAHVARPVARTATRSVRKERTVVSRVIEPRVVNAGAKIRGFCGQRHIRFQAGGLRENEREKVRNDALCRQVY